MKQAPVLNEQDMKRMLKRCANDRFGPGNRCMMMLSWLGGMCGKRGNFARVDVNMGSGFG